YFKSRLSTPPPLQSPLSLWPPTVLHNGLSLHSPIAHRVDLGAQAPHTVNIKSVDIFGVLQHASKCQKEQQHDFVSLYPDFSAEKVLCLNTIMKSIEIVVICKQTSQKCTQNHVLEGETYRCWRNGIKRCSVLEKINGGPCLNSMPKPHNTPSSICKCNIRKLNFKPSLSTSFIVFHYFSFLFRSGDQLLVVFLRAFLGPFARIFGAGAEMWLVIRLPLALSSSGLNKKRKREKETGEERIQEKERNLSEDLEPTGTLEQLRYEILRQKVDDYPLGGHHRISLVPFKQYEQLPLEQKALVASEYTPLEMQRLKIMNCSDDASEGESDNAINATASYTLRAPENTRNIKQRINMLRAIPQEEFSGSFQHFYNRCQKCVVANDYTGCKLIDYQTRFPTEMQLDVTLNLCSTGTRPSEQSSISSQSFNTVSLLLYN
ncbi:hypothetical protein C0J52_24299, partial [Blattella germanica]